MAIFRVYVNLPEGKSILTNQWCHAIESMESMVRIMVPLKKNWPLVTCEMLSQIPMSWEVENLWGKSGAPDPSRM